MPYERKPRYTSDRKLQASNLKRIALRVHNDMDEFLPRVKDSTASVLMNDIKMAAARLYDHCASIKPRTPK